jgi:hypothetical protein
MQYFIVARSREGWGVARDADLLQEFTDLAGAQQHAAELCADAIDRGDKAAVVDLSDVEAPSTLIRR